MSDTKNIDLAAVGAALQACKDIASERADLESALESLRVRNDEAVRSLHKATGGSPVIDPESGRSCVAVLDAGKGGSSNYVRGLNPPKPSTGTKKARSVIHLA